DWRQGVGRVRAGRRPHAGRRIRTALDRALTARAAVQPAATSRTASGKGTGLPLARSIQTITTLPSAWSTAPSADSTRWPRVTLVWPTRSANSSTTISDGYGIGAL